jgi:hypothetical protein
MKTFLTTTFAILLFTVICKAQWTAGTGIITTTNSVGIGTTTPAAALHVISNEIRLTGTYASGGTIGVLTFYDRDNTTLRGSIGDAASGNNDLYLSSTTGGLTFTTNSAARMYISNGGNMGLGSTNPLTIFHAVVPSAKATASGSVVSLLSSNDASNPFGLRTMIYGASAIANRYVTLQTTDYSLADGGNVVLQPSTGNVGVGTTTPDQKLTVNGTVHSKAVVVDNSIFPDYVFKKTYVLRPLSAVKAYIDLNHHLPEMPSAAEVAKNGQNLGEINTLLLKKVEELTLYMIELNKTVKAQQQEIEILKKK